MDTHIFINGYNESGKIFRVTNVTRQHRMEIVASSLYDLVEKFQTEMGLENEEEFTVVLEADGTEIDDNEYFATLESNTNIMVLVGDQIWLPLAPPYDFNVEVADGIAKVEAQITELIAKLRNNVSMLSLLREPELELISDMDPDSLDDLTFLDKNFLGQLKEASGRYLSEKRQAQDAIELLKLYHEKEAECGQMF